MNTKNLLTEQIEREREYLIAKGVGTEEYNESLKRLVMLEEKLGNLEQFESEAERKDKQLADEKKDRLVTKCFDIGKFVVGNVIVPFVGLVCITAAEKDITFTGALKDYTRCFIPKK